MQLPEPTPDRKSSYGAKRSPEFMDAWLELCAEIAALSSLDDWEALSAALDERLSLVPVGWVDVVMNEMLGARERLEAL